jgi:tetratricopeptide (TPR) repeat protein
MSIRINQLIDHAYHARREHRLTDAHCDLTEAVSLCRQSGTRGELVQALKGLGQIERDLGHGDVARTLYEEAVALCREEGDPVPLAHMIRHLGDIYREAGQLTLSEPCYHEALTLYRSHECRPLDLANAIRPMAILKETVGEEETAKSLWEEARNLYEMAAVPAGVSECSRRIAGLIK